MISPSPQPLLAFFEQRFVPEHDQTDWTRRNRQAAIVALGKFLKREPLLSDLDAETFEQFGTWLRRSQRYATSTVRSRKGAIYSVWKAAHDAQLASEPIRQYIHKQPWEGKQRNFQQFHPVPVVKRDPPASDSLVALLDRYREERDIADSTFAQCRYAAQRFGDYLGRPAVLTDFADSTVNQFLVALQQQTDLSARSVKSYRGNLLLLWRLAFECELVDELPKRVRRIKVPRKLPEAWTLDELRVLVAAAADTPGYFQQPRIRKGPYWVAFIACGFFTALRLGDLLRLEFDQIEPTGWLTMIQAKTGYPHRCYLPEDAMRTVAAIAQPKRKRIFSASCKSVLQKSFARIVKRAGLKGSAKTLRKTAATLAECQLPGSASWLLGHRDPSLARRNYIDVRQVQQAKPLLPALTLTDDRVR